MHQNPHLKYTTAICEGALIHSSKCAQKNPFFRWMCNEMKTTLLSVDSSLQTEPITNLIVFVLKVELTGYWDRLSWKCYIPSAILVE
jgi:hypothetical protein